MSQLLNRVNVWIQVFTSLSVIAGFGLVFWQLQLTRDTAIDQYALLNISDASADLNAVYGENAAEVLARACFTPDELSNADLVVLHHYFSNKYFRAVNVFWQSRFSGDENWENPASGFLANILMYPQGVGFLKSFGFSDPHNSPVKKLIEQKIAEEDTKPCDVVLNQMRVN